MALEGWVSTHRSQLPALRTAYAAEVEQLAEDLRPRFEAGELRGFATPDGDGDAPSPFFELERICCAHFRLTELETAALALLTELTPRAEATASAGDLEYVSWLQCALAWDVIAVARARGWYEPTPDEQRDPLTIKRCSSCDHLDTAHRPACRVIDCSCDRLEVRRRG
jgi:hypothetical protein